MTTSPINNKPSFYSGLYDSGRTGVNWLRDHSKTLTASAGDVLGKVGSAVSQFFSAIAQTLGQCLKVAKDSLFSAAKQFSGLSAETKLAAGVMLVVCTVAGIALGKCCGMSEKLQVVAGAASVSVPGNASPPITGEQTV